jgi:RimJ/RimL family protein N-acetyltransferase
VYTRLSDGRTLVIRPIFPSDKAMLSEGLSRLSEESRRRRFLTAKPRLSSTELRYLTEIDGWDHYALVAQFPDDPTAICAVARFVRLPDDPSTAEAAIVVCDAIQRRGLGTQLARMLGDAGRERGIKRFAATVLTDNPAALALMKTLNARVQGGDNVRGVSEYTLEIAA